MPRRVEASEIYGDGEPQPFSIIDFGPLDGTDKNTFFIRGLEVAIRHYGWRVIRSNEGKTVVRSVMNANIDRDEMGKPTPLGFGATIEDTQEFQEIGAAVRGADDYHRYIRLDENGR